MDRTESQQMKIQQMTLRNEVEEKEILHYLGTYSSSTKLSE